MEMTAINAFYSIENRELYQLGMLTPFLSSQSSLEVDDCWEKLEWNPEKSNKKDKQIIACIILEFLLLLHVEFWKIGHLYDTMWLKKIMSRNDLYN